MIETHRTKEIDGIKFTVSQLPAMKSLLLLHRLTKAVSPALAKMAGAFSGGVSSLANMNTGELSGALETLFVNLPAADFKAITEELLSATLIEVDGKNLELFRGGNSGNFDLHMRGQIGTIFKLLGFAFEVNYGNFFGWAKNALGEAFAAGKGKAPASKE